MYIDGNYIDENEFVAKEASFLKRYNNIYISEEQANILKKYNIDVNNYSDIARLIYDIEECISSSDYELDDLEWVSQTLAEYNYYNNTNK